MHFIFFSFGGEGGGWAVIRGWALKKYFWGAGVVGWALIRGWALIKFFNLQKKFNEKKIFSYDVQIKAIEIFLQGKVLI